MENRLTLYFEDDLNLNNLTKFVSRGSDDQILVVLKKECTTVISERDLTIIMNRIGVLLQKYDLFYLSSLMDSCGQKFDTIEQIKGLKIISSRSPNGVYGLASKRSNWRKILSLIDGDNISYQLNSLVVSGKITALTSWPRIYNTGSKYEFFPCRDETIKELDKSSEYELSVYYFMISCLILTIFLFYFPSHFP